MICAVRHSTIPPTLGGCTITDQSENFSKGKMDLLGGDRVRGGKAFGSKIGRCV